MRKRKKRIKLNRIAALFLDDEKWVRFERRHPRMAAYLSDLSVKMISREKTSIKNNQSVVSSESKKRVMNG